MKNSTGKCGEILKKWGYFLVFRAVKPNTAFVFDYETVGLGKTIILSKNGLYVMNMQPAKWL